jgi:molybdopterin converting factor small subunit
MSELVEIEIAIPTPLRVYVNNQKIVKMQAFNVEDCIKKLTEDFEGLKTHIYDENNKIRSFVNIYLNEDDVRYLENKELTSLKKGQKISIIPSIAGGK